MKKIVMCKGLPASGKSTWAKEFVKDKQDWIRVNNDEMTAMFFGEQFAEGKSGAIDSFRKLLINESMKKSLNIVVDNTNLHPKHHEFFTTLIKEYNEAEVHKPKPELYELVIKDFTDVSLDECLKRNKKRDKPVPEFVIKRMYRDYIRKESFKLVQDPSLPKAILVDIDGTMADLNGRNPHIITNCKDDLPNTPVIELVRRYANDHRIIFISGRNSKARADTVLWLHEKAGFNNGEYTLYMKDNTTPDNTFKSTIFDTYIRDKYYVTFALEDRDRMVHTYRNEIGITCLQVAEGDF